MYVKLPKVNDCPLVENSPKIRPKFAQSGHPDGERVGKGQSQWTKSHKETSFRQTGRDLIPRPKREAVALDHSVGTFLQNAD
jgi:hypothetical protein